MENVDITFTDGALKAISREAILRKSGARGLRSIMEQVMLDLMYEIPSKNNVREVVISEEVINSDEEPIVVYENEADVA